MDAKLHAQAYEDVQEEVARLKQEYEKLLAVAQYHAAKAGIELRKTGEPVLPPVGAK